MNIQAQETSSSGRRLADTVTFLDSASLYEVVAVFGFGKPSACYPWAWTTAVTVTHALMQAEVLRMAPAPSPAKAAGGTYADVSRRVMEANLVTLRANGGEDPNVLTTTKRWAAINTSYLQQTLADLLKDEDNFVPWLDRSIRDAWVEHAARLGGLFNAEFTPYIAGALGTTQADVEKVRQVSLDPDRVNRLVKKQRDTAEEFALLRNAYVVSALIRGYYHQVAARDQGQSLLAHPLRLQTPLPSKASVGCSITEAESAFASILLADALRNARKGRPERWVKNILAARRAAGTPGLAADNLRVLNQEATSVEAAIQAARTLEISCTSPWVGKLIDGAVGIGAWAVTSFFLTPFASIVVGGVVGAAGLLGQPSQLIIRDKGRLKRFAKTSPGAINTARDNKSAPE